MNLEERQKLFEQPTKEYQGKPFWSWNGRLEKKELLRQIDVIKEMGFGGYFMHSRTGLETEYLGEEWFELINACADYGTQENLESWLYDEDRWPSGSAGGMVTKEEKYRAMFLEMNILSPGEWESCEPDEHTVAVYALRLSDGIFSSKRLLEKGDILEDGESAVEFRTRFSACNDNYNGYCYLNTMSREAVEAYIQSTHEKYKAKCGEKLGKEILGVFTDEPHRGGVFTSFAEGEVNAAPYTPGMFEEFEKRFGYSLREQLPELFLRREKAELSKVTRDYFELCQELFLECFAIPIYDWCRENNLIFTGHVLHEDSLCCQSIMQGSLMRFYEYMDYPGIDLLGEQNKCYWVAKQIESAARQLGKEWILSELYGCTGWQMNFEAYKNVGDWQALFGVNLRCPHLSWYTMKGEAKRDYPASIFHQSSWYHDYRYVEDYFSRIHAALHGGKPVCSLLVLNPIESVWARAYSGAFDGLSGVDEEICRLEKQYAAVFHGLMDHQIDFDYGEEDILARHGHVENGILYVGGAAYDKVLTAGMDTMRGSTLKLLQEFKNQGGCVVFAGDVPSHVDVIPSEEVRRLAENCIWVPFENEAVLDAVRRGSEVKVTSQGRESIFVQQYEVDGGRLIMLLNTDRENGYESVKLNLGKGENLELWDARSGRVTKPDYGVEDGEILLTIQLEKGGERLYMITDEKRQLERTETFEGKETVNLPDTFGYRLTEPNICVLDMVTVTDDKGTEIPSMEVLKADRALRDVYGLPYRGGEMLQPWYQVKYKGGNTEVVSTVSIHYTVDVEVLPRKICVAVEDLEHIRKILVNETEVSLESSGKWIDICFDELEIPDKAFVMGRNTITLVMDYYKTCGIEAIYLLGDFGVEVQGSKAALTELPSVLAVGDITTQGLPFYSGSVIYEVEGMGEKAVSVTAADFGGSLVKLLGEKEMIIAFPPYRGEVRKLQGIEVVLTRRNTFGPLHQKPKRAASYGPNSFMTTGEAWSEDYVLYEQGLLKKPEVHR